MAPADIEGAASGEMALYSVHACPAGKPVFFADKPLVELESWNIRSLIIPVPGTRYIPNDRLNHTAGRSG
jgi:hypothetical protein